jgi:hypothetical protein
VGPAGRAAAARQPARQAGHRPIGGWSNPPYGIWLASLGRLVDATTATPEMPRTFDWVIRLELLFLDALDTGASW